MIRKLLVPLVAAGLLAGCVTGAYTHRGANGADYYYGRPSVDYRYHGGPYGYHPYGSMRFGYGSGYYGRHPYYGSLYHGYPFYGYPGYGSPYYGNPYYGYPYRPPVVIQPRPGDGVRGDSDGRRAPWRDLGGRRRMEGPDPGGLQTMRSPEPPREMRAPRSSDGGSRMERMMRRGAESGSPISSEQEP
ncbi:MAG: hypothetical protein AVDCRST_MAG71-573 [uncultured Lysobacter sp.]|uniref:Lipoprotein n=1 Tax=uncultured Lysobacter sp. TaxID=271060 RepID=A0A6J4KNB7_9GAMM|nr:MAG: hypothetical protein AVDCRST_MAG71-573 [uncultured Lysobacter sp.]